MSRSMRGKKLEGEFAQAGRTLSRTTDCAYWNSNDPAPCCDARMVFHGLSVLVECKETRADRLYLRCITDKERRELDVHGAALGLSLVAIEHVLVNRSRLFLCSWYGWMQIERTGVRGFSLLDGQRPEQLVEVFKRDRPHSLGRTWNLWPFVSQAALEHLERGTARLRELAA